MECIYEITKPAGIHGVNEGCNWRKHDNVVLGLLFGVISSTKD